MRARIELRECKSLTRGNKTWLKGRPEISTDPAEIKAAQADSRFSVTPLADDPNRTRDPATETEEQLEVAAPISERPLKAERTPVREGPAGKVTVRKKGEVED